MRRLASVLTAALLGALLAPLGAAQPAAAAPGTPTLTAPANGAVVDANPVLRWGAVGGASKYEVQVSNTQTFSGTMAFTSTTTGTLATPPTDLPLDTYWWRVRALDRAGAAGAFATASFQKVSRNAPTPAYPVNRSAGQELLYPQDSLYYKWDAFPGAKGYEVQIGTDSLFTGAPAPVAVSTTTYAPLTPPAFGTEFWWRVRAKSGNNVYSDWSVATPYTMKWNPTPVQPVSPPSTNSPSIEEVVLTWGPVAGASYYELQVSPDANFNNPVVKGADNTRGRKVVGTRFSDNDTTATDALNLPAGAYYWRVRAMSTSTTAEPGPWSDTWTFTRAWPATSTQEAALPNGALTAVDPSPQVTLLKPDDGDFGLSEPRLSWSPQRGASNYEVQFSSDSAFSPARVASCLTNHTTITPFWRVVPNNNTTCQPRNSLGELIVRPGVVAYWRVRALDGPELPALNGVYTAARSFLYEKPGLSVLAPANGATVDLPVLQWSAMTSISLFKVTLQPVNVPPNTFCSNVTAYTYNTTYVPETLDPKCPSWQWTVQGLEDNNNTVYNDGLESRIPLGGWRTFTWNRPTGSASVPAPVTTTAIAPHLPPLMRWPAVTGADKYQVYFSRHNANSFTAVIASTGTNATGYAFTGSASTALGRLLSTGDYDFFVRALTTSGSTIADSPLGTFHVETLPGATMTGPAHCPLNSCTAVEYDTPTFTWNSVPGAGLYILYLATDPNFTNITHEFRTAHTQFTPAESLPDSQAGQATYWYVRSCYMPAECGAFDTSVFGDARAFRKESVPVQTEAPVNGYVETSGQVRFAWKDYLYANQAKGVTQEAAWYQVQVSTTANFTNVVETSPKVDATEYTADTKTYPDGPLYWRVQAFDNTSNPLTFSAPISFTKAVAGPTGLAPDTTAAGSAGQTPLLTWTAQPFTTQYEVEIYKSSGDPSAALSPTNRVASVKTRLPSAVSPTELAAGRYSWRVRTIDINNNAGQWSSDKSPTPNLDGALAHFVVGATGPVLIAPANGSTQSTGSLEFSWQKVDSATRYRIEASSTSNFATLIESATTDMTVWSPDLLTPVWPNGTIYWRVHALDGNGAILTTSVTRSITRDASTAGEFSAVTPYRVLDTRKALSGGPLGAGATRTLSVVGGSTGIPGSGVSAVVLNATVTGPTSSSYLTLWPAGTTRPTVSTLNFVKGQTVANHATVPVDAAGRIQMFNQRGTTNVLIDVVGYYSNGNLERATRYTAAPTPTRITDTRTGSMPLGSAEARLVEVAGRGGVPENATAVVMNVTAVSPTNDGYFTVYPAGKTRPNASSLNFTAKTNVPNLVTMPLGTGGDIRVFNAAGSTHLLVDVVGWYLAGDPAPGTRMNSVSPERIVDTRAEEAPRLTGGQARSFQVRGVGGVPNDPKVTAAVVNVTVVNPAGNGYASVYPSGTSIPTSSNLNYLKGQTVANQVLATVGGDGKITVYSVQGTDVLVDVVGWFG